MRHLLLICRPAVLVLASALVAGCASSGGAGTPVPGGPTAATGSVTASALTTAGGGAPSGSATARPPGTASVPSARSGTTGALRIYSGVYTSGFEVSSFVPCGSAVGPGAGEGWWLAPEPSSGFSQRYEALVGPLASSSSASPQDSHRTVYVRFEGTLERGGGYGHLNQYAGQVNVHRVLEMTSGRCPGMRGSPPR